MLEIIGRRKIWFGLSLTLVILSLVFIFIFGLNFGIDFKGGTLLEIKGKDLDETAISEIYQKNGVEKINFEKTSEGTIIAKSESVDEEKLNQISASLKDRVGDYLELRRENIGPTVGKDITNRAIIAIVVASLAIILYIAYSFRQVSPHGGVSSWIYGIMAVVALIHDVLITVGVFAILGKLINLEVNSLFIVALLTVMGFSVHDTIVVYDRIRENLLKNRGESCVTLRLEKIVNLSVNETFARSINTSLTVILVLVSLIILAGKNIWPLTLGLLAGIIVGTYSSIFLASPLIVIWHNFTLKKKP